MGKRVRRSALVGALVLSAWPSGAWAAFLGTINIGQADVFVADSAQDQTCADGTDPISGDVGNMGQTIDLPGNSPALVPQPTHNSQNTAPSVWGTGWSSELDHSIQVDPDRSLTWTDGQGTRLTYFRVTSSTVPVPVYVNPINTYATLVATQAVQGTPKAVLQQDKDGTVVIFKVFESTSILRPAELLDRNGNIVDYARDSLGRLKQATDVHGRYENVTYNSAGFVASVADSAGRTVAYAYDGTGNKTSETGPIGTTKYAYDTNHRITAITYPNGGVRNYSYDSQGRVLTENDDQGADSLNYIYQATSTIVTDALGRSTVYEYTSAQGLKKVTKITDAAGGVTMFTYDSNLNLTSETDPLGRTTRYQYDANGNVTVVQDGTGATTDTTYQGAFNLPTSVTDPLGHATSMGYDRAGDLVQLRDAQGNVTRMSYDIQGHVTQTVDPMGQSTSFAYDPTNGGLTLVTDPLSRSTQMTLDALSQVTRNMDPLGKVTRFAYDPTQDLTQVTDAIGGVTTYTYGAGRDSKLLQEVVDANGHATTFGYDVLGRLTSVTNALGKTRTYAYDAKGNLTSMTNMRGQTITYAYDSLDRLITKTLPEGTVSYEYDAAGNLTKATNYNGSIVQMSYDALDRVTQSIQTLPDGFTATIGYAYDAAGNRTSMTTPWGNFAYAYDNLNRLTSITTPQGETLTFAYDSLGRRTALTYPNGIATTYAYDAGSQVTNITATRTSDAVVLSSVAYTYDAAGNRTTMTDWAGTHTYAYDDLHRLVRASHPAASMLSVLNETFGYDGVGNRSADAAATGYSYDEANRLTGDDTYTYCNDDDGNRTCRQNRGSGVTSNYAYTTDSLLAAASTPAGNYHYAYDAIGRRIEKTATARYIYDNDGVLAILDGSGNLAALFLNGPTSNEPLGVFQPNNISYFIHSDGSRNVVAHTDSNGQIAERVSYQVYGLPKFFDVRTSVVVQSVQSLTPSPYANAGHFWDGEMAMYHLGPRQYDPSTGRFSSADRHWFDGTNLYSYAVDNPTNFTDTTGAAALPANLLSYFPPSTRTPLLPAPPKRLELTGPPGRLQLTAPQTFCPVLPHIRRRLKVYRVWGGKSRKYGPFWTTLDPRLVDWAPGLYRSLAGLPSGNTGQYITEGQLVDTSGTKWSLAAPIEEGQIGFWPQVEIPNPERQVEVTSTELAAPPF